MRAARARGCAAGEGARVSGACVEAEGPAERPAKGRRKGAWELAERFMQSGDDNMHGILTIKRVTAEQGTSEAGPRTKKTGKWSKWAHLCSKTKAIRAV